MKWPASLATLWQRFDDWRYGTIDAEEKLGKRGEQAAAIYLRRKGYVIVAQGETDRGGEIDLIAVDSSDRRRKVIVFVEVKTQASRLPGNPADHVNEEKQRRLTRAALRYLKRKRLLDQPCRFDVVAVWWQDKDSPQPNRIEHYVHAFEAAGECQFFA